jgi:hypothetical protein
VPGLTPNRAAILRTPLVRPGLSRVTDALFQLRGDSGPAEALAFAPGSRKACADPFLNYRALELGKAIGSAGGLNHSFRRAPPIV